MFVQSTEVYLRWGVPGVVPCVQQNGLIAIYVVKYRIIQPRQKCAAEEAVV